MRVIQGKVPHQIVSQLMPDGDFYPLFAIKICASRSGPLMFKFRIEMGCPTEMSLEKESRGRGKEYLVEFLEMNS
jgi:hypothetical protein